eukprot:366332-Chlamydomonas_euryale.AAC.19
MAGGRHMEGGWCGDGAPRKGACAVRKAGKEARGWVWWGQVGWMWAGGGGTGWGGPGRLRLVGPVGVGRVSWILLGRLGWAG